MEKEFGPDPDNPNVFNVGRMEVVLKTAICGICFRDISSSEDRYQVVFSGVKLAFTWCTDCVPKEFRVR